MDQHDSEHGYLMEEHDLALLDYAEAYWDGRIERFLGGLGRSSGRLGRPMVGSDSALEEALSHWDGPVRETLMNWSRRPRPVAQELEAISTYKAAPKGASGCQDGARHEAAQALYESAEVTSQEVFDLIARHSACETIDISQLLGDHGDDCDAWGTD